MTSDDHARIAYKAMHPDEKTPQAVQFLRNVTAYYASLGVKVERLLTDNGVAFRSREHSSQREAALDHWNHHYNWHRRHQEGEGLLPCPDSIGQETTS